MKRAELTDGRVLVLGWQALIRALGPEGAVRFNLIADERAAKFLSSFDRLLQRGPSVAHLRAVK